MEAGVSDVQGHNKVEMLPKKKNHQAGDAPNSTLRRLLPSEVGQEKCEPGIAHCPR